MHGKYSQSSFARLVHESDNYLSVTRKRQLIDVFVEVDQTDAFTGLYVEHSDDLVSTTGRHQCAVGSDVTATQLQINDVIK